MIRAGAARLDGAAILDGRALLVGALILVGGAQLPALAQGRPKPTRTEIAPGIHLFRTAPYGDVGLDGNSIAIISSDGVLVFDTNGTPAAAGAVLAEIRTLTPQPVRYVVNSHWHWDHWYGTEVYTRAFPDVTIVAHERTRAMMAGPAIGFNRPGLEATLIVPGHGEPLRDKTLLHATMSVFRELLKQGAAAKARGLDPDAARAEIMPGLRELMVQITGDVPAVNNAFGVQLVDWYLHRVYDELNGPLTDAIAAIPPN